ncbi:MAG: SgcJ/EcaC family oxidoreductase [Acidobacteria bacterium]|nr:SgcJ/EcaC family oxidoreductase [Acidobacteriota bacterium]
MRFRTFLPLVMLLIAAIPCGAQTARGSAKDEAAIRQVLAQFEQAFEKRDAKIYAANFAEDADWENAFGSREKGRANIEQRLAGVYKMFQQANQTIKETRISFVTPNVAVADVDREIVGQVSDAGDRKLPPRRVRTTHVFRKDKRKWQVVIFRVTDLRNHQEVR